jgi:hypothetical protein
MGRINRRKKRRFQVTGEILTKAGNRTSCKQQGSHIADFRRKQMWLRARPGGKGLGMAMVDTAAQLDAGQPPGAKSPVFFDRVMPARSRDLS